MSCRQADTPAHLKRPVKDDGLCTTCWNARKRRRRTLGRLSAVRRLYGWVAHEIDALRRFQRGRCPICRRRIGVVKQGSMDHDHTKQRAGVELRLTVRGLLCSTCNRYLGHIGDDPQAGIRLAAYLIDPPAPHVLAALDRSCPER